MDQDGVSVFLASVLVFITFDQGKMKNALARLFQYKSVGLRLPHLTLPYSSMQTRKGIAFGVVFFHFFSLGNIREIGRSKERAQRGGTLPDLLLVRSTYDYAFPRWRVEYLILNRGIIEQQLEGKAPTRIKLPWTGLSLGPIRLIRLRSECSQFHSLPFIRTWKHENQKTS